MAEEGPTDEELEAAKRYLTGSFPLRFSSSGNIADMLVGMQLQDLGIDYLDMDAIPGVILLKKDFTEEDAPAMLIEAMGGHGADVVMSDMAWPTTGHRATDHLRIVHLIEIAADFAIQVLNPGGSFVAKVFQGGTEHELLHMLKRHFATTFHVKPPSSRKDSAEAYLVAKGIKGSASAEGKITPVE